MILLDQPIAGKFYTDRVKEDKKHHDVIQKYLKKLTVQGPKEKYETPVTENQRKVWIIKTDN